jgi:hypothetical protein
MELDRNGRITPQTHGVSAFYLDVAPSRCFLFGLLKSGPASRLPSEIHELFKVIDAIMNPLITETG